MALTLANLDTETRTHMTQEILDDIAKNKIYTSHRLNPTGVQTFSELLKEAAEKHDDSWLAVQLRSGNYFNATEIQNRKNGPISVKVPVTAPDTLAEGEFNRFYLQGLCLRAISNNIPNLVICRARPSANPRPESEAKMGTFVNAQQLLNDLRANIGIETALGVPSGPNSGISARLP